MSEFSNKELRITTREGIIRNIKKAIENKENIDGKFVKDIVDNYLIRFVNQTFMGNMGRILKEEILKDMCGFTTVEQLIKDHKGLKEGIKRWEKIIGYVLKEFLDSYTLTEEAKKKNTIDIEAYLEEMSHEMCAINM